MTLKINQMRWLAEADLPSTMAPPDPMAGGPPQSQPGGDPSQQGEPVQQDVGPAPEEDIGDDPAFPDMPEEQDKDDFEIWKIKYVKESIKGDPNTLLNKLFSVRERDLTPYQSKFVEDNIDISQFRQNANVLQLSNEIRKSLKKDFDRTFPATSVNRHITENLEKSPLLNDVYIKLLGSGGGKGDEHRKFVGSLLGAVQVGSGGENEDLIFEEQDYSIRISTRFNTRWGDVNLGRWFLREDDPDRYLSKKELDKLEGGSPEMKDVLRRQVVMESISEHFLERAFIINVTNSDGTICHLGWDLGNSLKAGYLDGKLVVRTSDNDNKESFIDEEGSIISVPNMSIYYVKEGDGINERGKPNVEEIEFIAHRDGILYLRAQLDLVKEAATTLQGMSYKETLWQGNPTDIKKIMRCQPSLTEKLLRQC